MSSYNAIAKSREIESIVLDKRRRKYYRFRYSRYYGGIITADTIGCNLSCAYCWNHFKNLNPEKYGEYYSSEEVVKKLIAISMRKGIQLFRITGGEPILGRNSMEHLIEVIKGVGSRFILETNGLILGYIPELVCSLNNLNVAVRVALKGWDERSFENITGADREYFRYQIEALKKLTYESINAWPAVMYDFFGEKGVLKIREKLSDIGIERIEFEHLERYPFVITNLRKKGIKTLPFEG